MKFTRVMHSTCGTRKRIKEYNRSSCGSEMERDAAPLLPCHFIFNSNYVDFSLFKDFFELQFLDSVSVICIVMGGNL